MDIKGNDYNLPDFLKSDGEELQRNLLHIQKALLGRRAFFLFGSGMSHYEDGSMPTIAGLSEIMLNEIFPVSGSAYYDPPDTKRRTELLNEYPFEILAEATQNTMGEQRLGLTKLLKEQYLNNDQEINQAHENFLKVINKDTNPLVKILFTTNFDQLLEKAIGERAISVHKNNYHENDIYIRENTQKIPVIHLHGVLTSDFQITETDIYEQGDSEILGLFRSYLGLAGAFIFVGFSLNDPDFRGIYREYLHYHKLNPNVSKYTYFVSPAKDEYSYKLGKAIWKQRKANWIPLKADHFFNELYQVMKNQDKEAERIKIQKKYNLKDSRGAVDNKVKELRKILLFVSDEEAYNYLLGTIEDY